MSEPRTAAPAVDAIRDSASTASEHSGEDAAPRRAVSRATYTTAYTISYGLVYAAVFIVRSIPQENAFMHGLRDGGVAARDALNGKNASEPEPL